MAIQRDYSGVDFGAQDTRTIYQGQINQVQFQPNKEITVGEKSDWVGKLIGDLGGKVANQLNDLGQQHLQDRYLEGAAKVGQIESEEEIQGNPITRDWEVAGYRDAHNRVLMADAEAQIAADMPKLREKSPAEMTQYLAELRGKLTPHLASGSREQRVANFAKLLTNTQAAQKKHAAEHQAYVQEVESKSLFTSISTAANIHADMRMKAAVDPTYKAAYEASLTNLSMRTATDIFENPKLSQANKEALMMEFMEDQLKKGGGDVYEFLANSPILDSATGQASTVLSRMSIENQTKLSAKFVEFQEKYKAQILDGFSAEHAAIKASLDSPSGTTLTYDDINKHISKGLLNKAFGFSEATALREKFLTASAKRRDVRGIVSDALSGNWVALENRQVSPSQVMDAMQTKHAMDNASVETRFGEYLGLAQKGRGFELAYSKIGEMLGPAYMQLLDPEAQIDTVNQTLMTQMDAHLSTMNPAQQAFFLQGMREEQRTAFTRLKANLASGMNIDDARKKTSQQFVEDSKMSSAERTARATAFAQTDNAALDSYKTRGMIGDFVARYMPSFLGGVPEYEKIVGKPKLFNQHPKLTQEQELRTRTELDMEARRLRDLDHLTSSEDLMVQAAAAVATRTVPSKFNPIIFPMGTTPQQFLGSSTNALPVDANTLGEVVDGMVGEPKFGGTFSISVDPTAHSLVVKEYKQNENPQGGAPILETTNTYRITPDQIRAEMARRNTAKIKREDELVGAGRKLSSGTGSVQYNGDNTAGVRQDWMFDFRSNLVANEGIRDAVYKDSRGKDTIGVGIYSKQYWPKVGEDGKASQEEISKSLSIASSDAAKVGRTVQMLEGFQDKASFLLFSEMAYQGGASGDFGWYAHNKPEVRSVYRNFVASLKSGDVAKAKEAFAATNVAKASGKNRLKHYESLIEQIMQGSPATK